MDWLFVGFFAKKRDMETKQEIIELCKKTFCYLQSCYKDENSCGRLFIPQKDGKKRLSEQECRFAFIEHFLQSSYFSEYRYSIETPTLLKYRFTKKGEKAFAPKVDEAGRSGNMDLSIIKDGKPVAIIEFKANNSGDFEHAKDFLKLKSEPGDSVLKIFIEIFESTNGGTIESLGNKLFNNKRGNIGGNTLFIGYSLHHNGALPDVDKLHGHITNESSLLILGPFVEE